jgi:hydrogenase maturation factor HypF (carbamoyltransferase family)
MKTLTMRYPGDPPVKIEKMTREEFLEQHPRRSMILVSRGKVQHIPVDSDCVICDLCNGDPGDVIFVCEGDRRRKPLAGCAACAAEHWLPYCK